jgi:endonuclease-8
VPEGDTIRRAARALERLVGEELAVEAVHPRARVTGVAPRLDGRRLEAVDAHGKHLLLEFDGGLVLRSHLGMTGSWRVLPASTPVAGSPWLVLHGSHEQAVLRGGSRLELSSRRPALGPDILATPLELDRIVLLARRGDPAREVGDVLLDQRVVAGIGNIWRSEALWAARTNPHRPVGELTDADVSEVLMEAARLMRSSVEGGRPKHRVYRRSGRPCARCGEAIVARRIGDEARVAYWCPTCQRGKAEPAA